MNYVISYGFINYLIFKTLMDLSFHSSDFIHQPFHLSITLQQQFTEKQTLEQRIARQKLISKKLIYLNNLLEKGLIKLENSIKLQECLDILNTLLIYSEFQKYGHVYNFYAYTLKRYTNLMGKTSVVSNIQKIMEIYNPISTYFQYFHIVQFSISELQSWVHSKLLHSFFELLHQDVILLQNPQCICCTRIFIKGALFHNRNAKVGTIIGISHKKALERVILQKYFGAICNDGGGVTIVGAKNRKTKVSIVGISFFNQHDLILMEKQILNALHLIHQFCQYTIERIQVKDNYLRPENEQALRICFRIRIIPNNQHQICYLKFNLKSSHWIYEIYVLNKELKPIKLNSKQGFTNDIVLAEDQSTIYKFFHSNYEKRKAATDSHHNIHCFHPSHAYLTKFFMLPVYNPANLQTNSYFVQSDSSCEKDEIHFLFQHSSFLIVASFQHDRYVHEFCQVLKGMKLQFRIYKPYDKYFKKQMRSIWLITHQMNFVPLRQIFQSSLGNGMKQKGLITMAPVFQNLEVETIKVNQQILGQFDKKFTRFRKQPYTIKQNLFNSVGQHKKMTSFHFLDIRQAVLGYMILQQLGLRPYTFKQNKKKEWKQNSIKSYST